MPFTKDTSSRTDDQLAGLSSVPETVYSPIQPRESLEFPVKAYSLMYGTGLVSIAAIVAWLFSLARIAAILILSLTWTGVTAVGSRPDLPNLEVFQAIMTLTAAILLTAIAVWMLQGFRKMINPSAALVDAGGAR